ncbi:hypothetical protein DFJ73DRAFT_959063 [Zopfochytrium polystomum]|nr:hypothetical protein DFJ73DRAFT_959063 [Zopfochytrium polystomum]
MIFRRLVVVLAAATLCVAAAAFPIAAAHERRGDDVVAALAPGGASQGGDRVAISIDRSGGDFDLECEHTFVATHEFRAVQPNECLPKGLHVRINIETGLKEAKLLSDDDATNENSLEMTLQSTENGELLRVEGDAEKQSRELSLDDLALLEESVGNIDDGIEFMRSPLSERVLDLLSNDNEAIRVEAARVLGMTLANNPAAQKVAVSRGWMPRLLGSLGKGDAGAAQTIKSELFLLGALLRGSVDATESFQRSGGVKILLDIPSRLSSQTAEQQSRQRSIKSRILSIVDDLFDEEIIDGGSAPGVADRWAQVRLRLKMDIQDHESIN